MPLNSIANRPQLAGPVTPRAIREVPILAPQHPSPSVPVPRQLPWWVTALGALVILGLFAWLFYGMFQRTGTGKPDEWNRALLLYDSVQVLVVAAVSTLLGVQVSRGEALVARTENARAQSEKATLTGKVRAFKEEARGIARVSESAPLDRDRLVRALRLLD